MASPVTEEEIDKYMRSLKILIGAFAALVLLPLIIYAFYLDQKLDKFQATLQHSSPEELEEDIAQREDLPYVPLNPVEGQVVYVPAYSHIYNGGGKPYLLSITLSVRNTSQQDEIVVKSIQYYDTKGKKVKAYLEKPARLPPLGTTEVVINRDDATGGSGANFLVEWYANQPVTEPIIEAVMIDTEGQQGISFVRRGTVISQVTSKAVLD